MGDVDEASFGGDLLGPALDCSTGNLDGPAADPAQQVVVVAGTATSPVEDLAFGRPHRVDEPGVGKHAQLVVDGRQTDVLAAPTQRLVQFLGTAELLGIVNHDGERALLAGRPAAVRRRHGDTKSSRPLRDGEPHLETVTIPDSVLATVPDKRNARRREWTQCSSSVGRRSGGRLKSWTSTAPGGLQTSSLLATVALVAATGCATSTHRTTDGRQGATLHVVAAENFWGSIATQLGGSKVDVQSIITNPDTDPHDYDPSAADARTIANATVVIENGIGYDPWVSKLLASDHAKGQHVINVGTLVGVADGGNPHRWYNPTDVHTVIAAITAAYLAADPTDTTYFAAQQKNYETTGLANYTSVINQIKTTYAGTPVGASESIFAMMAPALGLNLLTPPTFLRAISEGTDPTSGDKTTIDNQIKTHAIKVYVYNSQNATPDVQAQVDEAKAAGIPVTTITETLSPAIVDVSGLASRSTHRARDGPQGREGTRSVTPAVQFRDAAVRVGDRLLWHDVNVDVPAGQFVAILGPNGVGKSTLIKAALGVIPLAAGEAFVLGEPAGVANREIGYLPQRRSFDSVAAGARHRRRPPRARRRPLRSAMAVECEEP